MKIICTKETELEDFKYAILHVVNGRTASLGSGVVRNLSTEKVTRRCVKFLNTVQSGIKYHADPIKFLCKQIYNQFDVDEIFDIKFVLKFLKDLEKEGCGLEFPIKEIYSYNLERLKNFRANLSDYKSIDSRKEKILEALDQKIAFLKMRLLTYDPDIEYMTKTIYGEARGSIPDQYLVACVIRNRDHIGRLYAAKYKKGHPLYGVGSLTSTCLAPKQFSVWNKKDRNLEVITNPKLFDELHKDNEPLTNCWIACQKAMWTPFGKEDPTDEATHYHAKTVSPTWAKGKTPTIEISGGHKYFKGINKLDAKLLAK